MSGYVCNDGGPPVFIAQRGVPQGRKVDFEDLLLVFSRKSTFEEVEPGFVSWLKENVFSDSRWGFYNEDGTLYEFETAEEPEPESVSVKISVVDAPPDLKPAKKKRAPARKSSRKKKDASEPKESSSKTSSKPTAKGAGRRFVRDNNDNKGVKITPSMIIEADYSEASHLINQCKERPVLKKALTLSKHFSGKEAHMRHLIRRVEEVNP